MVVEELEKPSLELHRGLKPSRQHLQSTQDRCRTHDSGTRSRCSRTLFRPSPETSYPLSVRIEFTASTWCFATTKDLFF